MLLLEVLLLEVLLQVVQPLERPCSNHQTTIHLLEVLLEVRQVVQLLALPERRPQSPTSWQRVPVARQREGLPPRET